MKKLIKNNLIKALNPLNKKLGYSITETNTKTHLFGKNNLLFVLFENFKSIGFEPKHIIDIGANHGTWTREILKYCPDAYFSLFEPQEWLRDSFIDLLDNQKLSFHPKGVGKKNGSFKFTLVDRDDSCSFRYSEEDALKKGYEQIEVPIITLNNFLEENKNVPFPDLIKIDAEGLDLDVLEGGTDCFGKTEVFMVEVSVFNKSFDNSILKMMNYMDQKGYTLFDITDLNRPFKPKVLWLMELVFVKKDGLLNNYAINQ